MESLSRHDSMFPCINGWKVGVFVMLVNECNLRVSAFPDEKTFSVFCFDRRRDDFEIVGRFKDRSAAHAYADFMRTRGGFVSIYDSARMLPVFREYCENAFSADCMPVLPCEEEF
jgi:hypothetical protein